MTGNSERAGGFVRELGEAAQNNPLSTALIGMGAVWLFASRTRHGEDLIRRIRIDRLPDAARDAWEGTRSNFRPERVREAARSASNAVRDRGEEVADQVADAGKRFARAAADYADDLPDRASSLFEDARDNLGEMFRSQPLAIGAVGLAIGAAIAAALPTTETEAEYLGETSDFVKDKASELAGEGVERATEVGAKVAKAVADEARQQGLTTEGLEAAATDLSNKASRVAEAAAGSQSSRSNSKMPAPGAYSGDQVP
jgi:hypothetical protein